MGRIISAMYQSSQKTTTMSFNEENRRCGWHQRRVPLDFAICWDQIGSNLVPLTHGVYGCMKKAIGRYQMLDWRINVKLQWLQFLALSLPPFPTTSNLSGQNHWLSPRITVPVKWNVRQSNNYWTKEATMVRASGRNFHPQCWEDVKTVGFRWWSSCFRCYRMASDIKKHWQNLNLAAGEAKVGLA